MPHTVLLADLPPLLEDIVFHALNDRADMLVLRGSAPDGLAAAAKSCGAELVVVVRRDPACFAALDERLAQIAGIRVLALNADAAWGCLHTLQPLARQFDDISAGALREALEAARSGASD